MAIQIKADIKKASIRAEIVTGNTVRVNTTPSSVKTTTTQNVIKAVVKASGPQGEKGDTGDQGIQGIQGPGSNIRVYTWVIDTPVVGGIPGPRLKEPHTVTSIESYVTAATSVTFNIEERTTIGVSGSNLLTTDQVADTNGEIATTFADSSIATNSWIWLDISAVNGTPEKLTVTLSATV